MFDCFIFYFFYNKILSQTYQKKKNLSQSYCRQDFLFMDKNRY